VIALLFFGIISAPKVKTPTLAERYAVRHLDLHTLDSQMQRAAKPVVKPAMKQSVLRQIAKAAPARQTLIQPDIPKPLPITVDIPLPTVVIWNHMKAPTVTLVAPLPEKPAVAEVKPSIQPPNEETHLADISINASELGARIPLILPSSTSPVIVHGPETANQGKVTTAAGSAQPTSAAVMSLSDLRMADGAVTLPPVNQTASSNSSGALAPGQADGSGGGSRTGSDVGSQLTATHIALPKEGQFGAVVVGSSLEEKYPETANIWSGRLAYTVYLHVGLAKSWILQYSLSSYDSASASGNIMHIGAPWPYSIVRPNIAPGAIDADALMVHGYVNQAGRFEALAIAFPPAFAQAQFVLDSLSQWQFRPATQNGKNVRVEVLLIIPEILE